MQSSALLYSRSTNDLKALEAMSVAAGHPKTALLCLAYVTLWRAFNLDAGDFDDHGPQFTTGLVDVLSNPSVASVGKVLLGVTAAWYPLGKAASKIDGPEDRR